MMKKTLQKGAGKKIAVTFLLSLLIGYALTGLLRFLKEGGGLNALLLDVQGTLTFLTETDQQSQLLVAILTVFGGFMGFDLGKSESWTLIFIIIGW